MGNHSVKNIIIAHASIWTCHGAIFDDFIMYITLTVTVVISNHYRTLHFFFRRCHKSLLRLTCSCECFLFVQSWFFLLWILIFFKTVFAQIGINNFVVPFFFNHREMERRDMVWANKVMKSSSANFLPSIRISPTENWNLYNLWNSLIMKTIPYRIAFL